MNTESEREQLVKNSVRRNYYEQKIRSLMDASLPFELVLAACNDVPIARSATRSALQSDRQRRDFLNKCIRFYQEQIKSLEQQKARPWWRRLFG